MTNSNDEKAEISEINARCPQNGRADGAHSQNRKDVSLSPIYRRPKDSAPNPPLPAVNQEDTSDPSFPPDANLSQFVISELGSPKSKVLFLSLHSGFTGKYCIRCHGCTQTETQHSRHSQISEGNTVQHRQRRIQ